MAGLRHSLLRESGAARRCVRIYNQPEDAAYLRDDGSVGYRWDHFDRRADLILKAGLKPSVAFFSMPAQIAADPSLLRKRPFLDGNRRLELLSRAPVQARDESRRRPGHENVAEAQFPSSRELCQHHRELVGRNSLEER